METTYTAHNKSYGIKPNLEKSYFNSLVEKISDSKIINAMHNKNIKKGLLGIVGGSLLLGSASCATLYKIGLTVFPKKQTNSLTGKLENKPHPYGWGTAFLIDGIGIAGGAGYDALKDGSHSDSEYLKKGNGAE